MRAVIVEKYGTIEGLRLGEMPEPEAGPGEVLIRVAATSVKFVDLLVIAGKYQFQPSPPFIPGKGAAGTVVSVGKNVESVSSGQRVLAMAEEGAYAEYVTVPAEQCYVLPDSMSFVDAAAMAVAFDTAWVALCERARYSEGESVLVLGATGAVGNAAVQLARARGARVLAGISSMEKAKQVIDAGAHDVVDLSRDNIRDSLREQVFDTNNGEGIDIILDSLGGEYFNAALRALSWRGRLVVIGFAAGDIPTMKINYLLLKNIEVSGLQVSDYRKRTPELVRSAFEDIFSLYDRGNINAGPVSLFSLDEYREALVSVRNRIAEGRAVLKISD